MKRIKVFVLSCLFFTLCVFGFSACKKGGKAECTLLFTSDTQVVIRVDKTDGNAVLVNAMEKLQEKGELTFTLSNGMVTSVNGVENDVDYNPCWMVYTSDAEMASTAWGSIEYEGQTLGSAVVGVESLTVIEGGMYLLLYQTF